MTEVNNNTHNNDEEKGNVDNNESKKETSLLNNFQPYLWFYTKLSHIFQILIGCVFIITSVSFLIAGIVYLANYSSWTAIESGWYADYLSRYLSGYLAGGVIMLLIGIAFSIFTGLGIAYKYVHIPLLSKKKKDNDKEKDNKKDNETK